jgi:hypothetical protein
MEVIRRFEDGSLTKAEALERIRLELPRSGNNETYFRFVFASYSNMLDKSEGLRN